MHVFLQMLGGTSEFFHPITLKFMISIKKTFRRNGRAAFGVLPKSFFVTWEQVSSRVKVRASRGAARQHARRVRSQSSIAEQDGSTMHSEAF